MYESLESVKKKIKMFAADFIDHATIPAINAIRLLLDGKDAVLPCVESVAFWNGVSAARNLCEPTQEHVVKAEIVKMLDRLEHLSGRGCKNV